MSNSVFHTEGYKLPPIDLINRDESPICTDDFMKEHIAQVFKAYGIKVRKVKATVGPTVSFYEVTPGLGINYNRILRNDKNISITLGYQSLRFIVPIPRKNSIGIEIPNKKVTTMPLGAIFYSEEFQETDMQLPCAIGKTVRNEIFMFDLAKERHIIIAGDTRQEKTNCLNAIMCSLHYKKKPSELQFVLIDPMNELDIYSPISKHFLAKMPNEKNIIVKDNAHCLRVLQSLRSLTDSRYKKLKEANVKSIIEYNQKFPEQPMPYIVTVIGELRDFMLKVGLDFHLLLANTASYSWHVGIHFIICTNVPVPKILTGFIKVNFPARIAFRTSEKWDSYEILDGYGAEHLIGKGDMLSNINTNIDTENLLRVQSAFIEKYELRDVVSFIAEQEGRVQYELPSIDD